MPPTVDVMKGRAVYLKRCWMCHGDAGQGDGPSAKDLRPVPANFTDPDLDKMPDDELFWKVTAGIHNAAMPQWGLLLSEEERWNAIDYVKRTFIKPSGPQDVSDELPIEYGALESPYDNTPAARAAGADVYTLCAGCHGAKGLGNGPFGKPLIPTPANLTEDPAVGSPAEWWYWRVDQGVVGFDGGNPADQHPTAMPAWRYILTDEQRWDVIYYARDLVGSVDATGGAN
ncbi:MAG: c-type cytochrome [Actinobacteria bacterium]|nr:MAG: c-type cytochrome [Actinomycetota bacterium]